MTSIAILIKNIECEHFDQLRPEIREFLGSLYQQMIHQPVVFTASGFYTINFTLLASISTGIVSYQIILVQFYASTLGTKVPEIRNSTQ